MYDLEGLEGVDPNLPGKGTQDEPFEIEPVFVNSDGTPNTENYEIGDKTNIGDETYINTSIGWYNYAAGYTGEVNGNASWSKKNWWKDLSDDYNSVSGYDYSFDDLRMREIYRSSRIFKPHIDNLESNGLAEPFGKEEWISFHGVSYYNMFRLTAGVSLAFQFVGNGTPKLSTPKSFSFSGINNSSWSNKLYFQAHFKEIVGKKCK